jgi:hypothetical protein
MPASSANLHQPPGQYLSCDARSDGRLVPLPQSQLPALRFRQAARQPAQRPADCSQHPVLESRTWGVGFRDGCEPGESLAEGKSRLDPLFDRHPFDPGHFNAQFRRSRSTGAAWSKGLVHGRGHGRSLRDRWQSCKRGLGEKGVCRRPIHSLDYPLRKNKWTGSPGPFPDG